jgi:hypothetical protein
MLATSEYVYYASDRSSGLCGWATTNKRAAMKRIVGAVLVLAIGAAVLCPMDAQALNKERQPGGVPAFFIGCCFGLRQGTQWNEGVDLHWREWIIFAIWNGIDCANGMTAHEFAEQYGANWY